MRSKFSRDQITSQEQRIQNSRLYALFWRWHFITGFFAVPLLVLISLTGAIAVFRPELYPLVYPSLFEVEPRAEKISVDDQVAAVRSAYPNHEIQSVLIYPAKSPSPTRVEVVQYEGDQIRRDFLNPFGQSKIFIDPYSGKILGRLDEGNDLFATLINLHISLFAPPWGRLWYGRRYAHGCCAYTLMNLRFRRRILPKSRQNWRDFLFVTKITYFFRSYEYSRPNEI